MSKKAVIIASIVLVLLGAAVFGIVLLRSRTLADVPTAPQDVMAPQGSGGSSSETGGTGNLGSGSLGTGNLGSGSSGLGAAPAGPTSACGDGVCDSGESCRIDCGSAEEQFQGSVRFLNPSPTSVTVTWRTLTPSTGTVDYGETESYGSTVDSTTPSTSHEARLDLAPGRNYFFRIRVVEEDGTEREYGPLTYEASSS